jgi:hypothetical protein
MGAGCLQPAPLILRYVMSSLEVVFEVPEQIVAGLATGSLQRIGGVIVESDSKQVVTWLRDGVARRGVDDNVLPKSFNSILAATGTQANFGNILSAFTVGGQILNLAVTAVSFQLMMQKLDRISKDLTLTISREFARDRLREFRVALEAARDVFEVMNADNRKSAMRSAIDGLNRSRDYFFEEFQSLIQEPSDNQSLLAAKYLLILGMHAAACRSRCFLAGEEVDLAKSRLAEDLPVFLEHTQQLVKALLGKRSAIYLHKDIGAADMACFLSVQQWLHSNSSLSSPLDASLLFQIVDELRVDFWNSDLLPLIEEDNSFPAAIARTSGQLVGELAGRFGLLESAGNKAVGRSEQLIDNLTHAVVLIENYERLLGFEMEVREFRLASGKQSFQEWSRLVNEEDLKEYGIGIIVDRDRLDRLAA